MPQIERLTPEQRYAAAVAAVQWALDACDPPIDRRSPAAQLLTRCLEDARSVVGGAYTGRPFPDGGKEVMESIMDSGDPEDVQLWNLLLAAANCYAIPETGTAPEHLYTVLSDCYAAVVHRHLRNGTLEAELTHPQSASTIAWQKELIGARPIGTPSRVSNG